mgnify:CR=1 FL=1
MTEARCRYNCDDGWVREQDGYGCVQWTHCVCVNDKPKSKLTLVPISLREANQFVANFHRGLISLPKAANLLLARSMPTS